MKSIDQILSRASVLTFDCYGTLIDWKLGMQCIMKELLPAQDEQRLDELFLAYLKTEAAVEAKPYRRYREVLAAAFQQVAREQNIALPPDAASRFAESLVRWPVFSDTTQALNRLAQHFRLAVLSNIDRDLFAQTARTIGVPFDFVITAEDVQAYKPSLAHFRRALERTGNADAIVHVAQSPFHDGIPTAQLGIAFVWTNRYNETHDLDVHPAAEYETLSAFADVACKAKS